MAEIAFIAPYEDLANIARQVSLELGLDLSIHVARMEEGANLARELARNGCQVIVSRGVTAWLIQQAVDLPVVDVPIGGYDILRAYYQAKQFGGPIGIADVPDVIQGLESLETILGETFLKYTLKNQDDDIRRGILALKEAGAEVIIGKIAMAREARNFGLNSVIITSGKETVYQALKEARRVLQVRHQEKRRAEQLKAILDFAYDGIIALDEEGRITVFNPVAEKLSGWRAGDAIGRPVTEVIPNAQCHTLLKTGKPELGELLDIGNTRVVANRVPIIVDGRTVGVVTTFQNISSLQSLEHKVRRRLAGRGHVAKYTFADILGESPALKEAVRLAREYASVQSTVLIHGETGSGKEMFAHAIHLAGPRQDGPFVAVNCAALPENLLESELFGYAEGAFTGARKGGKPGLFELAHEGTIFLDEIGEMSPRLQARVLRVLEEGEIMRLGDDRIIPVNVRVIAATHRNLAQMVKEQSFREDLYYRINVLNLEIPPLRERGADVLLLAEHFLQEFCRQLQRPAVNLTPEAARELLQYRWPGNVRELRNCMERLSLRCHDTNISAADVRQALGLAATPEPGVPGEGAPGEGRLESLAGQVNILERGLIMRVLAETGGNKAEAARRLGVSRTTLWRKLKAEQ
ncbi:sigma 54-interacting transcriptional regulator [Neomoorella carbonis]|uniref:sigma 54-interacting transcriptional regulator n=1 Tax=Neomoorella carbonis TaxID=3062783 RepID=UPI003246CBA6